ncbi:sensor histidine kinase [Pseudoalteromonas piscicida]|uniref:sensor histidine kinase n=1 Tax=Pseudoalteromonas piscicida TaxID=43662 RepID=UPI000E358611|nr:sensor histidine kinase [Pseudoalteromonas piscicida]AXR00365.1 HAMP domain-containing protein [Pseudoalteromonas piscicida]
MKKIFSQSLQKQALIAMFIGVLPILTLTLWYAQALSKNQQKTQDIYNKNQKLILEYNFVKADISALEKALQNNQLLQSETLQESIEQKWQNTKKRIQLLKINLPDSLFVAKWRQFAPDEINATSKAEEFQQLVKVLNQFEESFQQTLNKRLSDQESHFVQLQTWFMFGLVILLPTLIVISIFLINRICQQLNQVESAVSEVGKGNFDKSVELSGSHELQQLGDRLNWLRLELKRIQQQKETFLRHVTHELKTPLASLNEGSSLLNSGLLGDVNPKQQRILIIMENSVAKLGSLIDDLLSYSAASHPDSLHHDAEMNLIQEEVSKHLSDKLGKTDVIVNWQNHDDLKVPYLPCKLVLTQLVSNAIDHAKSNVTISIKEQNGEVLLIVRDDGDGIDINEADSLFQPFVRGEKNKNNNGSGLGLAIVSECVKQLKGDVKWLSVESGASIQVAFPKRDPK